MLPCSSPSGYSAAVRTPLHSRHLWPHLKLFVVSDVVSDRVRSLLEIFSGGDCRVLETLWFESESQLVS